MMKWCSLQMMGWMVLLAGGLGNAAEKVPEGLAASDWGSIRAEYERHRHGFYQEDDGSHVAHNPGQGWRMKFAGRGFVAQPEEGGWQWGLELVTEGQDPAEAGQAARVEVNRLRVQRSALVEEWYVNDGRGLEQGWTVAKRLQSEGPLRLELAVVGTLQSRGEGSSVRFETDEGAIALTYGGLRAWDADGTELKARMVGEGRTLRVEVEDAGARYPVTIDPIAQQAYVKASNTDATDQFGQSVAISGDTVVVGARFEDSAATGINGNQVDNSADDSGAAYVFVRSGGVWIQQAYLKASNTGAGDYFGWSVAVSGDTVVVGAYREDSNATGINGNQTDDSADESGAAYVFVRQGGVWTQQAYLKASNSDSIDRFGYSVAVSIDTVVVGAYLEDSAATGINGIEADNSAEDSGAAYVFVRKGSVWVQQAYLKASNTDVDDSLGWSVSVSGDTIILGAVREASDATGVNGNQANNNAGDSGAAYVFVRNQGVWAQQAYLKASNTEAFDNFGWSVAHAGDTVVVSALGEDSAATGINGDQADNSADFAGAAYVFVRQGGVWIQQAYLKASNTDGLDQFGYSVTVTGDTVAVGAIGEKSTDTGINGNQADNSANFSGAVYVFMRQGGVWTQQAYLKASNTDEFDRFGISVAASDDTMIVGAVGEESSATGINGDQADNSAGGAGAAYIFNLGEALDSLAKTRESAPGAVDLKHRILQNAAIAPGGAALFQSRLLGTGTRGGGHSGMFSWSGMDYLSLQTGAVVSGVAELPVGAWVRSVFGPVGNRSGVPGLFLARVSGTGINGTNNRLLLYDNGSFISPVSRTGLPVAAMGGALPRTYLDVLQREGVADEILLNVLLRRVSGVTAANDSGLLRLQHDGMELGAVREGDPLFGGGGVFGQMRRVAVQAVVFNGFIAATIPPVGRAVDSLFYTGPADVRWPNITQGNPAGGVAQGETYRTFTGLTRQGSLGLVRATLTGSRALNEGVWNSFNNLMLRKGDDIGGGVIVTRILRVWGLFTNQILFHVRLGGAGVNSRNNEALILRQINGSYLTLLRTGQQAPGVGEEKVTVARLQSIAVDLTSGRYAVLGSLRGAPRNANQALWSGNPALGDFINNQHLRLPLLLMRKGEVYQTAQTDAATVRSLAIKPVLDRSGVGGRGEAQVINDDGQILVEIRTDGNIRELVRLTP